MSTVLRLIPSVDEVLRTPTGQKLKSSVGSKQLTALARAAIADIRSSIRSGSSIAGRSVEEQTAATLLHEAERRLEAALEQERLTGLTHVINATGVILHTNLGRAPLSQAAVYAIQQASRYCNLEYDTVSGSRGRRGIRVESLLAELTGAEDALVVNNCAAAALLILSVLAKEGETIVSRGELVEIGGDFRIPDVMATSGTRMIEVGTTNRTHIDDYRRAITKDTRLLMRVHPSNYRIVGFASSPDLSELVQLARESHLPLYEDAGSGQMRDLTAYGVTDEYSVAELVATGADVISFSGDKLLGSAQAGIIVGKTAFVSRLRKHPLYRALRIDKLRLAALEASLRSYQRAIDNEELPVIQMLSLMREEITSRAERLAQQITDGNTALRVSLVYSESAIGGGAGPTAKLPTTAVSLTHRELSAEDIERRLRSSKPPVIARILDGAVMLDLRTVFPDEEPAVIAAIKTLEID
ncbi:MAG TPA: L-seryl-tRNA(Sec) selenium transferase [Pyrinomonadaceae bacterium]|nr:L-seryl-tRNA(Sec) selenium transferase [Pyrinomonadaceae bacterium]